MLNRKITISVLALLNFFLVGAVAMRFGLGSLNNWLLIVSVFFMTLAIYRVLGMVEGYKN